MTGLLCLNNAEAIPCIPKCLIHFRAFLVPLLLMVLLGDSKLSGYHDGQKAALAGVRSFLEFHGISKTTRVKTTQDAVDAVCAALVFDESAADPKTRRAMAKEIGVHPRVLDAAYEHGESLKETDMQIYPSVRKIRKDSRRDITRNCVQLWAPTEGSQIDSNSWSVANIKNEDGIVELHPYRVWHDIGQANR